MFKILLVDDEKPVRQMISDIVGSGFNDLETIAEAGSVAEAFILAKEFRPDLVLLDIQMPDGTGFDFLQKFRQIPFKTIFITAYEEFAVKAFKFSAIDYLLKPVDPDELISAVQKAREMKDLVDFNIKMNTFFTNLKSISRDEKKIVLKTAESIYIIGVQDIIRCEADKNYTQFFLIDGRKPVITKTIKDYDEMLAEYGFFRSHQSHLINIRYIESFEKKDGGYILMKDKSIVPVSQRKREQLIELFEHL
jgi:two-component system, LytTR family, response regulator